MFDYYVQPQAAQDNLVRLINESSTTQPLYILGAGPMESLWRALNAAKSEQRQFVYAVSHSPFNEKYKACDGAHNWFDARQDFESDGVTFIEIRGQNRVPLYSSYDNWIWLENAVNPELQWLYSRPETRNKFDVSDAGMSMYYISGALQGGCERCGNNEMQTFFPIKTSEPVTGPVRDESLYSLILQPGPDEVFDLANGMVRFLVNTNRLSTVATVESLIDDQPITSSPVDDLGYTFFDVNLPEGRYAVSARVSTNDNRFNVSDAITFSVIDSTKLVPEPEQPDGSDSLGMLYIIDPVTDERVQLLEDGGLFSASLLSENKWNMEFVPADGDIKAIVFYLNDFRRIERAAPYALYGDRNGDYSARRDADLGEYDLTMEVRLNDGSTQQQSYRFRIVPYNIPAKYVLLFIKFLLNPMNRSKIFSGFWIIRFNQCQFVSGKWLLAVV